MYKRFFVPTIVLWVFASIAGVFGWNHRAQLQHRYSSFIETNGTLVEYIQNEDAATATNAFTPVISFTTKNSTDVTIESTASLPKRLYTVGKTYTILYDPMNINEVHFLDDIRKEERMPMMWVIGLIAFGVGIVVYPVLVIVHTLNKKIEESRPLDPIVG